MRLIVDSDTDRDPTSELETRLAAARQVLTRTATEASRSLLLDLADQLRASTPPFFLNRLGPEDLAQRVTDIYRFLAAAGSGPRVHLLPLAGDRHLLLTLAPDAPFLVHSVQSCLIRRKVRFQLVCHPILAVRRQRGAPVAIASSDEGGRLESLIVVVVDGLPASQGEGLTKALARTLETVLAVKQARRELLGHLKEREQAAADGAERDFCHWLQGGSFIPFSYRRLRLVRAGKGDAWSIAEEEGSAVGLPPDPQELTCCRPRPLDDFDTEVRERLLRRDRVVVETLERISPVLRNENLFYIGIREGEGAERVEHAFLGLFTEQSNSQPSCSLPPLRRRIEQSLERLGIPRDCHDWRKTTEILNTFPKVELFFMAPAELDQTIHSFTQIYRHGVVKVVATRNLAVHGVTLLLIMPREFYGTENLGRIEVYLARALRAPEVTSRVIHISSDYLSLHVTARPETDQLHLDLPLLEKGLTRIVRPWKQRLLELLQRAHGEGEGRRRWERFATAFRREYRTLVHPRFALRDLRNIEQLLADGADQVDLWGPFTSGGEEFFRLQFYSLRASFLNDLMPVLENLTLCVLDEVDFSLEVEGREIFVKSFSIRNAVATEVGLSSLRESLLDAFLAIHRRQAENDYLNRLLILTGLDWQEIDVFRGYRNYYFQLGSPFTKRRVAFALINNPRVARLLFDYFAGRFRDEPRWADPLQREEEALSPIRQELATALEAVSDINEDRILRTLFNLIDSTVRTNFFLRRTRDDYFFAFKISALGIIDMPAPRPLFEIYVHAATMEGIHLRGGKVARGGIRWSDRPDDFRTEILGLMKTQMTKNALIVPVGSKGGFVVKTPFTTREEGAALSKAAYQVLMRGLLDLTDNRAGGEVRTPPGIVAYDEADPYLVVAADKGTAQFSDTANAVSRDYGFWLDDAFASGGSHGYDHKALGITARGAWEGVKRHFRELGRDIQEEPFTVVGIGDMSGDVFGNGMLLSRQIRLLAAFDHRHIFLDPDPDPAGSYRERERLFQLSRSSWADYDATLISAGGGVFPRDAKEIPLSPQIQRWLGVRHDSLDGPGLIQLLLTAEVDLLWNGGIGTYVKASTEKDEDAGDRSNDAVRVDANRLRAQVVGEGGNLGLTQRARIEYAQNGGRINTDAVDNSGGVDCSDHEVNLKILMQQLLENGLLDSLEARNRLLAELTDEVVTAVLANNFDQCLCLSLDQRRCAVEPEAYFELLDRLARAGLLDRRGEFLPTVKEVLAREGVNLVRPELAILMAYSKMQIYQTLLESDLPDRPALNARLVGYFPRQVQERYGGVLPGHPLAREITATVITNDLVAQAGSAFFNHLAGRTGVPLEKVIEAYLVFDAVLDGSRLRQAVLERSNLDAEDQYRLLLELEEMLGTLCEWALERGLPVTMEDEVVADYRTQAERYRKALSGLLPEARWAACKERASALAGQGFAEDQALQLATLGCFEDFLPLVELLRAGDDELYAVAKTYNEVRTTLGIEALLGGVTQVPVRDRWDRLARQSLLGAFRIGGFRLARAVLATAGGNPDTFFACRRSQVRTYQALRESLRGSSPGNFHPYTVLARTLEALADAEHGETRS